MSEKHDLLSMNQQAQALALISTVRACWEAAKMLYQQTGTPDYSSILNTLGSALQSYDKAMEPATAATVAEGVEFRDIAGTYDPRHRQPPKGDHINVPAEQIFDAVAKQIRKRGINVRRT